MDNRKEKKIIVFHLNCQNQKRSTEELNDEV